MNEWYWVWGTFILFVVGVLLLCWFADSRADTRFMSRANCGDGIKRCISSEERVVDGFKVKPPIIGENCWELEYTKTCSYRSKNDCTLYEHCYGVGDVKCLEKDLYGACVNMEREFSCKRWGVVMKENQTARIGYEEKAGRDGLVCAGVPCIDGNCVDKSYFTDGEMMDSLSKLSAVSQMRSGESGSFSLFSGEVKLCSKKMAEYSNCCQIGVSGNKGWSRHFGNMCTLEENELNESRSKKLCVYVGAEKKKNIGVHTVTKHKFCCFKNILDKVVQVEGRKQLGKNFGSGYAPDCRGLSLEEIQRIDWERVDFGEFIEDLKVKFGKKYKEPSSGSIAETIENSMEGIRSRKYEMDEVYIEKEGDDLSGIHQGYEKGSGL